MHFRGRQGRPTVYSFLGIAVLALFFWWVSLVWNVGFFGTTPSDGTMHGDADEASVKIDPGPTVRSDAGDLGNLEERARAAAKAVLPTVVAVVNPAKKPSGANGYQENSASGVIVDAKGIVLSQWHVSHQNYSTGQPFLAGEKTTVILHDGRECPAKLLGANCTHDISLLQLLTPGPYPYAPIHPAARVRVGEWVLKIGHPLGYRKDRPAPVRLGRVLCQTDEIFATDCMLAGGDSGGPYFSLDGQLLGIVQRAPFAGSHRLHGAMQADPLLVQRTHYPNLMQVTGIRVIDSVFSSMMQGNISPRDMNEAARIEKPLESAEQLRVADWSQGSATLTRFRPLVAPVLSSVVVVLHGDIPVALGTIVGAEGWIVTKASELPTEPACRLADGRILQTRVIGAEPASDLALLKVAANDLSPVRWAENFDPPVGTVVAAAGTEEDPVAMGVVSVRRRDLAGISLPAYSLPLRLPAGRPQIYTTIPPPKTGFKVAGVGGLSWAAGIRRGDVLRRVGGQPVREDQQLMDAVKGLRSGDVVDLELERRGKSIKLHLPLRPETGYGQNYRADGFPTVVECAVPFLSHECGGPVVDLEGRTVGITIARLPDYGGMVIPGDSVLRLLPDFKAGKYADNWAFNKSSHE